MAMSTTVIDEDERDGQRPAVRRSAGAGAVPRLPRAGRRRSRTRSPRRRARVGAARGAPSSSSGVEPPGGRRDRAAASATASRSASEARTSWGGGTRAMPNKVVTTRVLVKPTTTAPPRRGSPAPAARRSGGSRSTAWQPPKNRLRSRNRTRAARGLERRGVDPRLGVDERRPRSAAAARRPPRCASIPRSTTLTITCRSAERIRFEPAEPERQLGRAVGVEHDGRRHHRRQPAPGRVA